MEYISVGRRAGAFVLDAVVLWILFIVIIVVTGDSSTTSGDGGFSFEASGGGLSTVLVLILGFGYFIVLEATVGATLGKLAVGVRVRMDDGSPLTWSASVVRNLLRIIDGLLFYLVGAILVWNSSKRQRLGDRAAHSVVVAKESIGGLPGVPEMPAGPMPVDPPPPPPAP
jgi:uncharacterized RDD family membrane protein YckC